MQFIYYDWVILRNQHTRSLSLSLSLSFSLSFAQNNRSVFSRFFLFLTFFFSSSPTFSHFFFSQLRDELVQERDEQTSSLNELGKQQEETERTLEDAMTRLESAEEELTDLRSIKEVREFTEIFSSFFPFVLVAVAP